MREIVFLSQKIEVCRASEFRKVHAELLNSLCKQKNYGDFFMNFREKKRRGSLYFLTCDRFLFLQIMWKIFRGESEMKKSAVQIKIELQLATASDT